MTVNGHETGKNYLNPKRNDTNFDAGPSKTIQSETRDQIFLERLLYSIPSVSELKQYSGVILCGLSIWGTTWFVFQNEVVPGKTIFNMVGVVIAGYIFGHTLERYTTINPVVGMTLIGALYRYFGSQSFLDDPVADVIDYHLRRIYPVIILTKGPLSWNWEYIKNNAVKVFSLATLPWIVDCLSTAFFAHVLLEFPWYWGLHLGAILASVSPAIVVPTVMSLSSRGLGVKHQIAQLVANAGGLDTAFTEGLFGIINSAIFYPSPPTYRILKISHISLKELCLILACIFSALFLRLLAAFLVALANELSVKESLFIAITWIPKAIVEAVLVRVATDSLWTDGTTSQDKEIAAQHSNIIVIAILITSTIGSVLTTALGPILLSQDSRVAPEEFCRTHTLSPPQSSVSNRRNNPTIILQTVDIQ